MAVVYIAVIAASEYPAFREICDGRQFPADYDGFLKRVERRKEDYRARGYKTRAVDVDFAGFERRRRRSSKRATYRDLDRYAVRLVYRKQRRR